MPLQTHSLPLPPLLLPTPVTTPKSNVFLCKQNPFRQFSLKCSISTAPNPTPHVSLSNDKPVSAEVSRTIMELSSVGTLSTLTNDGWPFSVGVRFAVDDNGSPVLCLPDSHAQYSVDKRSSLHVQLEQCGMRTPQCTIQGSLEKPEDEDVLKLLHSTWKKKFGEEVNDNLIYAVSVERILQVEDFMEHGVWVSSTDYKSANPDPLRNCAEALVSEINANNSEDVYRFCNVYVDLDFQVSEAKIIWVDRLGFDVRIFCPQKGVFDARIPFPREVTDEKGAKSSFNGMSQLAWEVEKNYHIPDFEKVKQLKQIPHAVLQQ